MLINIEELKRTSMIHLIKCMMYGCDIECISYAYSKELMVCRVVVHTMKQILRKLVFFW